ncbi:MAG TPA: PLP-dependent aminotransferase family protein [Chloroflexota bacterium]|nr:PLP-dependent aminotransferase family protein [Chloroflexota bacterium]
MTSIRTATQASGTSATIARTFDFGSGMPDPGTFPVTALAAASQRAILEVGASLVRYPDARGYAPLRQIPSARFARNHGVAVPVHDVVITNGSMQGIILATQALCRPGDTVVLEEFCYSGTLGVLRQFGAHLAGVSVDEHGMRLDALETVLDRLEREGRRVAFLYTIATHQNPTGTIMPVERRRQLVEICRRRSITIVEDDCYADVVFEGEMPPAMYSFAEPGTVLYIGSFSKVLGPGVRLGYFIAPEALATRLLAYKRDGGTSSLSSAIVAEYLKAELWSHISEVCAAVKAKRDRLFAAVDRELGGLVERTHPMGGLFTWLRLPDDVDTQAIAQLAKERNVIYGLGRSFDAADRDIPFLRLAFGFIDEDLIDEGISLLGECIEGAAPGGRGRTTQ